jgi:rare lipoprotein A
MIDTPLVLTPTAPASAQGGAAAPASAPPKDIESLMLADRAPADYAAPNSPAAAGGFYLQLGAYSRAENAEAMRSKLGAKFNIMEVVQGGSVFRLFGGPFATRQEAQQAAQGLPSSLGLKPIVVQR